jgi:5-methylcytosine-specific restriction endonuclease McrA
VAVAPTEREWLEVARGKTVHQLEALVAGKTPGDKPSSPSDPSARRHVLRFEVTPETLALFREAMNQLRRSSGSQLDDDSALMLMARHVLGGPSDEGRASYQIALSVCPECARGGQQASGELVPIGAEFLAMADCDGQHLGLLEAPVANASEGTTANDSAHRGAPSKAEATRRRPSAHTGARVKQTIAPATRRAVLRRDHQRCTVPGCRNALFLDLHHIELSSEGGGNKADNLVTLCGAHHRAAHSGQLDISGKVSTGVRFRHPDGSDYGQLAKPQVAETHAKAFAALRCLGFRERAVRRVLAELWQSSDGREPNLETVLRSALSRLTTPCASAG